MHATSSTPTERANRAGAAMITGASSGIGAAFARRLAGRGHATILVARRRDRLDALAREIEERFGVEAQAVPADLADLGDLERVEDLARRRPDLAYLVNNAGFGMGGRFPRVELQRSLDMLRVHCEATVRLCRAVLPAMLEANRGAIINVSSVAGIVRVPGSAMYSSTKAFLNAFSETLALELRGTGVRIQALCPGFTYTEFHDTPEMARSFDRSEVPKFLWLDAEGVVDRSFAALERDRVVCITGWWYRVFAALSRTPVVYPLVRRLTRKRQQAGGKGER